MKIALGQARDGRMHILGEMRRGIDAARDSVSAHAPRITTISIPREKIRDVIGSGGKVIREICAVTGAKIDIEDEEEERSEEHTSELQSLMRNSYAVFCL